VLFNEFILTSRPYIRTVTEIRPEWLLQYGGQYFDLSSPGFPESETKRALKSVLARQPGKSGEGAGTQWVRQSGAEEEA